MQVQYQLETKRFIHGCTASISQQYPSYPEQVLIQMGKKKHRKEKGTYELHITAKINILHARRA